MTSIASSLDTVGHTTAIETGEVGLIYQTNVRSAYAAGQWQQFQETKEAMPYLRYLTAGDERVRDSHQPYNNAAYHIDDPFWQTNYPPNGYNCRCTVIALSSI